MTSRDRARPKAAWARLKQGTISAGPFSLPPSGSGLSILFGRFRTARNDQNAPAALSDRLCSVRCSQSSSRSRRTAGNRMI